MGILEHCATQNMNHFRGRQYFIQLYMVGSYKVTTSINITIAVSINANCISGVMVSVLTSSAVDRGFETRSVPTKDYKIGICCFSFKHTTLRRKSKTGWLGIRIMCQSVTTCLSTNCCFSELAL